MYVFLIISCFLIASWITNYESSKDQRIKKNVAFFPDFD